MNGGLELGLFCVFGGRPCRQSGGGTGNWVCFAFFGGWLLAIGSWLGEIGFVLQVWACQGRKLGSFCIIWVWGSRQDGGGTKLGSFGVMGARHAVPVRELGSFCVFARAQIGGAESGF